MTVKSLFRRLLARSFGKAARTPIRTRRISTGLRVNQLEDRVTPALLQLNTTDTVLAPAAGGVGYTDVAVRPDGAGFVTTWQAADANGLGVFAQRYDANWQSLGGPVVVNTVTTGQQDHPSVGIDAAGNFVVAWRSQNQVSGTSGFDIYARRFQANGTAIDASEFLVNTTTALDQVDPQVAVDAASGRFAISWWGGAFLAEDVFIRSYAGITGALTAAYGEVQVNNPGASPDDQGNARVAIDTIGNAVVVFDSFEQDAADGGYGVYFRRVNAAGTLNGGEVPVNTVTAGAQGIADVAMDGSGNFVIVWQSVGVDGSGSAVMMQRYNASAVAQGGNVQVNTFTTNSQSGARVSRASGGDYVITWEGEESDGDASGGDVYYRKFNSAGTPLTAETVVNTGSAANDQTDGVASVSMTTSGDFVVGFEVGSGAGASAVLRRFGEAPVVEFASASGTPGESVGNHVYNLNRSAAAYVIANVSTAVSVTRTGGTATPGTDFTTTYPDAVTIPATAIAQTMVVAIFNDALVEPNETIILGLAASPDFTIGATSSRTITILDDDLPPPAVNLSVSANAGTEVGTTAITVTATADAAVTGDQTVSLGVSGTGITAGDYTLTNTTITILNGQTTGTVTFTVSNDNLFEPTPETATLTISGPSSGIVLGATTTQDIAITDNDAPASLTITGGNNQSALVSTTFASLLAVTAKNAAGDAIQGVTVTFAGPGSGASITSSPSGATNASGAVSKAVAANATPGPYTVTATATGGTAPTADFNLTNTARATVAVAFGAASIGQGGTTTLTYTITNPNPSFALTGLAMTDVLPAGLVVAPSGGVTNVGGTLTAVAGTDVISLTGGTIAAGATATVVVNVTGTTLGVKTGFYSVVTSTEIPARTTDTTQIFPYTGISTLTFARQILTGNVGVGDAQQTGRINRLANPSVTGVNKPFPGMFTTAGARLYDSFSIANPTASPQDVQVWGNTSGTAGFVVAYLNSFNPADPSQNYLADPGSSFVTVGSFGLTIPAGQTVVLVVHEVNPGTGVPNYAIGINTPVPFNLADLNTLPSLTVVPNNPPVANDDAGGTLTEDGANGTVNVIANDTDVDGNPTAPVNGVGQFVVDLDTGTAGVQTSVTNAQGVWTLNTATGVVTFDPANNFNGPASLTYSLADPAGASDTATISFSVTAVNDDPVANDDTGSTLTEDGANGTVNVIANDTDVDGNPTAPVNGVGQFVVDLDPVAGGVQTSVTDAQGVWTLNTATGVVTFDPANNFNGPASLTYSLSDPAGASDTAVISFSVTAVNDEPSFAQPGNVAVNEDSGPFSQAGFATGFVAGPANESGQAVLAYVVSNNNNSLFSVQPSIAANGTLTFTPAGNANGTATVTVQVRDNGGTANGGDDLSPALTFTITVNAVNDEPSFAQPGNVSVNEDSGPFSQAGFASGFVAGPANESGQAVLAYVVSNDNNALFSVQPSIAANGTLTFTPAGNANGTATVTVQVRDNGGTANGGDDLSPALTFTITVNAVNDEPSVAVGANQSVTENAGPQTVTGFTSGFTPGPANESGQAVLAYVVSNNNNGLFSSQPSIAPNGTLTYTSAPNMSGVATVTVQVRDNGGVANGGDDLSPALTFTITVTAVPPVLLALRPVVTGPGGVPTVVAGVNLLTTTLTNLPWQIVGFEATYSEAVTASAAALTGLSATGITGSGTSVLRFTVGAITSGSFAVGVGPVLDLGSNASVASGPFSFTTRYGDVTGNGFVTNEDVAAWRAYLASGAAYDARYDLNGDGVVDNADLVVLRGRIGK